MSHIPFSERRRKPILLREADGKELGCRHTRVESAMAELARIWDELDTEFDTLQRRYAALSGDRTSTHYEIENEAVRLGDLQDNIRNALNELYVLCRFW